MEGVLLILLSLPGNIRVFCHIRPTRKGENSSAVVVLDSASLLLNFEVNKTKIYSFDKVFRPASSQDDIFGEIEPVIKSTLDGHNACIFAYGQTGTGKTFTMVGQINHKKIKKKKISPQCMHISHLTSMHAYYYYIFLTTPPLISPHLTSMHACF